MISKQDAMYSIRLCDVNTICMGFDLDILKHLHWEFFGMRAPQTWDSPRIAEKIKSMVEEIDRASDYVGQLGIMSEDKAIEFLTGKTVRTLIESYSKEQLYNIYVYVFQSKPLSNSTGLDIAEALIGYRNSVGRATALLSEPDGKGLSVSELQSRYSKQQLIKIWEGLYTIKCNKRRTEDIAWDIWNWYADEERTRDLTKILR